MDLLAIHPKLVHLPIALSMIVPIMAIAVLVGWWRGFFGRRTWFTVVGLQAMLLVGGIVALRSGEIDEEQVHGVVAKQHIEAHEHAAKRFVAAGAGALVLMFVASVLRNEKRARLLAAASAAASIGVLGLGYQTGEAGGALVYQHGAARAFTDAGGASKAAPKHERPAENAEKEHDED